ncbi:DUF2207 domain-containing protein [Nocardiopsis sp. HNM0947]|uniref:DUF2207 domain-containing protein n=1 Tax=Nocardiopsis coralli TaxID=2772213 RepID=A0ABR9PAW5_9ACTN|nr:DUF2207 domain-containing protein [Nocardiopsis coralli]MBE3000987.1 DUF2207 domain-containing protein [Nocardiopsis coralli]
MKTAPLAALAVAAVALTGCTTLGGGEYDRIPNYRVDAEVGPDGDVAITETITYDFSDEPSPGLYREMPVTFQEEDGTRRPVEVHGVEVVSPSGAPTGIRESETSNGWYTLRVGDTSDQVTGEQTYELSYTLTGAVTEDGQGRPELYWDFIGTGWSVPIDSAQVTVDAPGIEDVQCAVGDEEEGWEEDCGTSEHSGERAEFAADDLGSGAALTAAVRMPEGAAETSDATTSAPLPRWLTLSGVAWLVGFAAAGAALLWFRGMRDRSVREKARRTWPAGVPPQLSAAAAGYLLRNEKLHPDHVLGALMEMEEKGLLFSRPHPTRHGDYTFEPGHAPAVPPAPAERVLLEVMFRQGSAPVDLDVLAGRLDTATARNLGRMLREEGHRLGLYRDNARYQVHTLVMTLMLFGVFLTPPLLNDTFHLGMGQLTAIGAVLFGLCLFGALLPSGVTPYGHNVTRDLAEVKHNPAGNPAGPVDPRAAWATGLRPSVLLAVGAPIPVPPGMQAMRPAFHQDEAYRRRWTSRLHSKLTPSSGPSGGGGSSGGGFSAGGGGGGGGGGRG